VPSLQWIWMPACRQEVGSPVGFINLLVLWAVTTSHAPSTLVNDTSLTLDHWCNMPVTLEVMSEVI